MVEPVVQSGTPRAWVPETEADCQLVRSSLEDLLRHPLFSHSRRLPAFLRFVVLASLEESEPSSIKERTIGVMAFGRQPDYDTNLDPVVRITAGEVRKKLAQYYYDEGRDSVLRIELPPGGYLPRFLSLQHESLEFARGVAAQEDIPPAAFASPTGIHATDDPLEVHTAPPQAFVPALRHKSRFLLPAILLTAFLLGAGLLGWRLFHRSESDRFWQPLTEGNKRVLIVLPALQLDDKKSMPYRFEGESIALEDAAVATKVTTQLAMRNLQSPLALSHGLSLSELRAGPAILVGALDNPWTMRVSASLPFVFERSEDRRYGRIVNTLDPSRPYWSIDFAVPNVKITRDYGVVARYHDALTDQPVVLLAGLSAQGTFAAGEAVTTPQYLHLFFEAGATARNNFEAVIETETVDGKSGPPRIVTFKTW